MEKIEEYLKTELFNHGEQLNRYIRNFLIQCEAARKFEEDEKKVQEELNEEFEDLHYYLRLTSSAPPSPHHHPLVNGKIKDENDDGRRSVPPNFKIHFEEIEDEEKKIKSEEKDEEKGEEEEKKIKSEEKDEEKCEEEEKKIKSEEKDEEKGEEEEKNTGEKEKNSGGMKNRGRHKKRVYPWLNNHGENK
uniref:Uncharacterized protein n=1 Tax=Strongyloides venezuelensis TaxID=75913 RepID=A0A0K0FBX4_STRVS